jgi:hypothetical protein
MVNSISSNSQVEATQGNAQKALQKAPARPAAGAPKEDSVKLSQQAIAAAAASKDADHDGDSK